MLMTRARPHTTAVIILTAFWAASGCWPARLSAQTPTGARAQAGRQAPGPGPAGTPPEAVVVVDDQNARDTREQLRAMLDRYPPALGRVLKLDPSLLANQAYLAAYPALAAFLAQHPEVARNAGYFLAFVPISGESFQPADRETQVLSMWRGLMGGLAAFAVFLTVMATLAWLVRLLVDYRRWSRLSKVQADAHSKLLDRFTANDELLAYVQSPAGSRFLQSAPIALDPGYRSLSAPLGRILWSIQAGLVLAAGGLGLQFVSGRIAATDVAQPLFAMGVLGLALGIGFVLSAVVAFVLSRRLGLFEPPAVSPPNEHRQSTGA